MLTGEKNIKRYKIVVKDKYLNQIRIYRQNDQYNSRTDIIEDTGSSLSPEIDIGQIEGAFMFGLGLWTSEEVKFHPTTGKILTYDTWVRL